MNPFFHVWLSTQEESHGGAFLENIENKQGFISSYFITGFKSSSYQKVTSMSYSECLSSNYQGKNNALKFILLSAKSSPKHVATLILFKSYHETFNVLLSPPFLWLLSIYIPSTACGSLLFPGRKIACNYFLGKELKQGTVSASGIARIQKQAKNKKTNTNYLL